MCSRCGTGSAAARAWRCPTPKRCCSSTTAASRRPKRALSSACVPTARSGSPASTRAEAGAALLRGHVARQQQHLGAERADQPVGRAPGAGRRAPRSAPSARPARRRRAPAAATRGPRPSCPSRRRPAAAAASAGRGRGRPSISASDRSWAPVRANGSAPAKACRSGPSLASGDRAGRDVDLLPVGQQRELQQQQLLVGQAAARDLDVGQAPRSVPGRDARRAAAAAAARPAACGGTGSPTPSTAPASASSARRRRTRVETRADAW